MGAGDVWTQTETFVPSNFVCLTLAVNDLLTIVNKNEINDISDQMSFRRIYFKNGKEKDVKETVEEIVGILNVNQK